MSSEHPAILVFNAKRNLIRIHRQTLHMLNDPAYIQILVNPQDKIIALRPGNPNITKSERVNWNRINRNHSFEMYSASLSFQLLHLLPEPDNICSIRLKGTHYKKDNLVAFRIGDAQITTERE